MLNMKFICLINLFKSYNKIIISSFLFFLELFINSSCLKNTLNIDIISLTEWKSPQKSILLFEDKQICMERGHKSTQFNNVEFFTLFNKN